MSKPKSLFEQVNALLPEPLSPIEFGRYLEPNNYTNQLTAGTDGPAAAFYPVSLGRHNRLMNVINQPPATGDSVTIYPERTIMLGDKLHFRPAYISGDALAFAVNIMTERGLALPHDAQKQARTRPSAPVTVNRKPTPDNNPKAVVTGTNLHHFKAPKVTLS